MSNAVVTGNVDFGSLEVKSSGATHHFKDKMMGNLTINGVRVMLHSSSIDHLLKTINRFTPQTNVIASVAGSSTAASANKYLVLTSPEEMHLEGDIMDRLGIPSGVTLASTSATTVVSTGI